MCEPNEFNDLVPATDEPWAISIRSIFDHVIRRKLSAPAILWRKPFPKIELCLFNSPEQNAFATKVGDHYAVGIFSGLHDAIQAIANTVLSDSRAFVRTGNPDAESVIQHDKPHSHDYFTNNLCEIANRIPLDSERKDFAEYLKNLTMRFVVEHEIAHISLGHLDANKDLTSLNENSDRQLSEEENFGIEMQADEIAFGECIDWVEDSIKGRDRELRTRFSTRSPFRRFKDLYTGVYYLFETFSHLSMSNTHPCPLHRQLRLGMMLEKMLQLMTGVSLDDTPRKLIVDVIKSVDKQFEHILGIDWTDRLAETIEILDPGNGIEPIEQYNKLVADLGPKYDTHSFHRSSFDEHDTMPE